MYVYISLGTLVRIDKENYGFQKQKTAWKTTLQLTTCPSNIGH